MKELQMGVAEARFADLIWAHAPLSATELAKYGAKELQWKKTTSYTVLKRLCEKGIFQNQSGTVTVLLTKEQYYAMQSEKFVEETFKGSLPAFLAAFTARKALTEEEVDCLRRMIAKHEEG